MIRSPGAQYPASVGRVFAMTAVFAAGCGCRCLRVNLGGVDAAHFLTAATYTVLFQP